jgi:diguanylate cyclase (GGDEF)-like protein
MMGCLLKIKGNKIVFSILVFVFLCFLSNEKAHSKFSNTGQKGASDTKQLLFLGNKTLPPMIYTQKGKTTGIVVDLAEALKKRMEQPVEIKYMDWSQAQQLVLEGRADALLQINPSQDREKIYDFPDSLLESEFSIFSSSGCAPRGISDLKGVRVGVEKNGLPIELLKRDASIKTVIIPDILSGFHLLSRGELDVIIADRWVGCYIVAEHKIKNIMIRGTIERSNSAIAVKKGNLALLQDINKALAELKEDGTYAKILRKWEPKQIAVYTKEQVFTRQIFMIAMLCVLFVLTLSVLLLLKEIKKRKKLNEKLKNMATTDPLTGLLNRRAVEHLIDREMYRKNRYDHHVSLLLLDLDHFKQINDQFGHAVGDEVLAKFSEKIKTIVRKTDSIARWGGEEFIILASDTDITNAVLLAEKIRKTVKSAEFGKIKTLTTSIGVAEYHCEENFLQWYKRVDGALYKAKIEGRDRVVAA